MGTTPQSSSISGIFHEIYHPFLGTDHGKPPCSSLFRPCQLWEFMGMHRQRSQTMDDRSGCIWKQLNIHNKILGFPMFC